MKMMMMMTAALLLASGLAAAQDDAPLTGAAEAAAKAGEVGQLDKDLHADKAAIKDDKKALSRTAAEERVQIMELNKQEDAAIARVRADFKAKRDAVRKLTAAERKTDRDAIGAERKGMSNDAQERHDIQNSGK